MLKKLKRKFVLVTMSIVLAMLAVIFGLIYYFTKTDMENAGYAQLQHLMQVVSGPGGVRELPRDLQLPYFIMQIGPGGQIVAQGYTDHDLSNEAFLVDLAGCVRRADVSQGIIDKYQLMYCVAGGPMGQVVVFVDVSGYNATLTSLIQSSLIIGAVSLLVFLLLSILLARWMVRPVEKAWQQQKQFVSDASHELKTPLTVIMSNAELLQDPEYDAEHTKKFADSILVMSRQMRSLVEGLLELARADNGQVRKNFARGNFSSLVTEALLPFEPVFFEKGLQLHSQIQPDIYLVGSGQHLKQVVDILLDNAGKYSAPGIVNVSLEAQGKRCLLTVSNPGAPIPKEDLEKIFERFYRADEARSRTGSFGLGLSIARAIVIEHAGRIWAVSNETGNCFCVELPCV